MTGQAFLSETRERFLKAILAELPLERVRELYVFPPIRQGGVESGVAVVAGYPEVPEGGGDAAADAEPRVAPMEASAEGPTPSPHEPTEPMLDAADLAAAEACDVAADERPAATDDTPDATPAATGDVPAAPDRRAADAEKYTVYTARYRHVLKGPDRGKWEASLVAEAEAPLLSIESVVRGVQRRAGDVEAPDHMTADDLRTALRLGPPRATDAA